MNNLDNKVIVDREVLQYMIDQVSIYAKYYSMTNEGPIARKAEQALAADLTGWAAVPVNFTLKMYYAGAAEKTVRETYSAMLEASPPLPGVGSI